MKFLYERRNYYTWISFKLVNLWPYGCTGDLKVALYFNCIVCVVGASFSDWGRQFYAWKHFRLKVHVSMIRLMLVSWKKSTNSSYTIAHAITVTVSICRSSICHIIWTLFIWGIDWKFRWSNYYHDDGIFRYDDVKARVLHWNFHGGYFVLLVDPCHVAWVVRMALVEAAPLQTWCW